MPYLDGRELETWCLFFVMSFCHIFANYRAVRSLRFEQ